MARSQDPLSGHIPGLPQMRGTNYTVLFESAQRHLGFDPQLLVNVAIILAAASTALVYAWSYVYKWASSFVLSSAHVAEDDALYSHIMSYMGDNYISSKRFRQVKAKTGHTTSWKEEEAAAGSLHSGEILDSSKLISYRSIIGRIPIQLAPYCTRHLFQHKGHWMYFKHSLQRAQVNLGGNQDRGYISIQCFGRSLEPIRDFLKDTQTHHLRKNAATTTIYRALGSSRDSSNLRWHSVLTRPYRDIRTVILDREKKRTLLVDINEYLHPRTRRWYSDRGIPYRRGYLFSGPPGTGKTSLSSALAGVFGLNIYVVSLLDPNVTESHLNRLLSEVPSRCIVLLEDVDAAGLKRPRESARKEGKTSALKKKDDAESQIKDAMGMGASKPATEISLSGLLNAIDGVSSHEGRILVMTTNHPEELDHALIRPGRIDMHIAFTLPAHDETRELFLSMYRDLDTEQPKKDKGSNIEKAFLSSQTKVKKTEGKNEDETNLNELEIKASQEMKDLATEFANAIPEKKLSLASIQGYLLGWKRDPKSAVQNAAAWAEESLQEED